MKDVLIVDDNESSRKIARYALEGRDLQIIESIDGERALECILDNNPQLIVLDWQMPKLSGGDMILLGDNILERIQLSEKKLRMDVILYSSFDLDQIELPKSKYFRFVSYVSKKWPMEIQVRKIKSIIRKKSQEPL